MRHRHPRTIVSAGSFLLAVGAALIAAAPVTAAPEGSIVDTARQGDAHAVLEALAHGAAVNATSADGTTALHWAVHNDDVELVKRLIGAGADVNVANKFGATPLTEAAVVGDVAIIEQLVAAGVQVDAPGKDGQTALMVLARGSSVAAARLLLEHGANVDAAETWRGQTALVWAAAQRQPEMVKLLLEHGANPDAGTEPTHWRQVSAERRRMFRPFGGLTALLYAAREGCLECARALVEGGADIDLSGYRGITPLIMALDNYHFDLASYLVDAGASLDIWDWWGRSPLYKAIDMNTLTPGGGRPDLPSTDKTTALQVTAKILEKGANPNLQLKLLPPLRDRNKDRGCDSLLSVGATPLLRAAKTFDTDSMRLLIQHGARIELPTENGITPLMAAAGYGSVECDLRGYGPGNPNYVTDDVEEKSIQALQLLIDAGADVNAMTTGGGRGRGAGQTALFGAAFWGWNKVVEYLVAHNAKIDVADANGKTARDAALGRTAGHERGGTVRVFEGTSELLEMLCREQQGCKVDTLKGSSS
jgi:ankyrin repeat protein